MHKLCWRRRREAYLLESGRTADLLREGFIKSGLVLIDGGGRRRQGRRQPPALILVGRAHDIEAPSPGLNLRGGDR